MGVPRPTEMTVRRLLQKELEKRGVKVNPEVSFVTPVGRMMPDIVLQNGGDYVVETKLGAEAKLFDALIKLYDYSKYTEARGAFAILFPEELRRPWPYEMLERIAADPKLSYKAAALFKDLRPTQQFAGNLSQMADWIASHVLRPPVVEADTSLAIRVLSDAVDFITTSVRQLGGKELEDIFGGETVFENILQYEESKYPLEEMRKAATYLLINQILFYHVLSSADPSSYKAIDEAKIERPGDLTGYFNEVLKKDYTSTFGFDVASRLPDGATEMVRKVVKVVKALAPEKIKHDVLGKVFHELIPFEIRKAVAAFYTNNEAAEILAQLAIDSPDAKVIDLAVGSGTLLVASYRRKRELLLKSKGYFGLEDHKRFLNEDLTGIDIMPFAAHLAVVALSLQALLYETERVRIGVWDSTGLKPGQVIPAISRELRTAYRRPTLDIFMKGPPSLKEAYVEKGALTFEGVGGEEIPLEKCDLVIMNPPFTRQERIPKDYKDALFKRLKEYKNQLHGQLGLWGYFLLLADRFVKPGGRMALVYPARPLSARSAERIRRFLLGKYHIEYIITTWERAAFSESAQYREILFVMRKIEEMGKKEPVCRIVNLKSLPKDLEEARSLAHVIKTITSDYNSEHIRATILTQQELRDTVDNWFLHIASFDPKIAKKWTNIRSRSVKRFVTFREYLRRHKADVIRGVETKSGFGFSFYETFILRKIERALKSYDQWFVEKIRDKSVEAKNRLTGETIQIPSNKLCKGIRRASGMETLDLSECQDYILVGVFEGIEKVLSIDTLENFKEHSSAWKKYIKSRFGRFLISRRFNLSAVGTKLLAFYSDEPTTGQNLWSLKDLGKEEAKILTLWFNSTPNLLQVYLKRVETEGAWMEINRGMTLDFSLLDPDSLNDHEKKCLLKLFEEVKNVKFPCIMEQLEHRHSIRRRVDEIILKTLGFKEGEIEDLLSYLYPALANEIEKLKALMKG